ncbi:MAG: hypothetical protein ACXABY_11280 [Candidatus Thorarchaeota archaeon]|jgi:hypothetical protein
MSDDRKDLEKELRSYVLNGKPTIPAVQSQYVLGKLVEIQSKIESAIQAFYQSNKTDESVMRTHIIFVLERVKKIISELEAFLAKQGKQNEDEEI